MTDGLRPGVALVDVPGHGSALRDRAGRLVGVDLPAAEIVALRHWFAAPQDPPPDGLDEAIDAFARAGHLGTPRRWPAARRSVVVLGGHDAALDARVAAGLAAAGATPTTITSDLVDRLPEGGLPDDTAAVCALAAGPAPASWTALDALARRGVAWQRISVEGRHGVLEPVAAGRADVGHRDVRARRLAAAGSGHPHLAAYWASGDRTGLDDADRALLAALAVADLRAWALDRAGSVGGSLVPSALPPRRRLRVVDLDTGAIADHPVLPVPDCAP